jgi:two-component sensor histidine kinase
MTVEPPDWERAMPRVGMAGQRSVLAQVAIGAAAALAAIAIRYAIPLRPDQIPTATVVIMVATVTAFVGLWAGITTATLGGLLAWYLFFNPQSWSLDHEAWVPLLGYAVVAGVILITSHLYRASERLHHERELARVQAQADTAQLFARELAHRLGNTLAIVQAVALQTIGKDSPDAKKFAGRLKALSDANHLLAEHVDMPTAQAREVVEAALAPFTDREQRFRVSGADAPVPAQQVLTLALGIHELATNASKYGALSTREGWVTLTIEDRGDQLQLTWKEHGGPLVSEPEGHGFGTRLLRRAGVATELVYESDGLRCLMGIRKAAPG